MVFQVQNLNTSDCIKKGDHRILDVSIDQGKWFAAKVLKENEEISKNETIKNPNELPKEMINRQCFYVKDGKCILKKNHDYYYQVQMQLLVTKNFAILFVCRSD